ncbi:type II secretion system F family protein [Cellulomonas carbonis]|nr:type II secretion system F family protein [Cellulomonas carbonis]GGC02969.1 type II secretion system protein [Cellulomonas carbonis]
MTPVLVAGGVAGLGLLLLGLVLAPPRSRAGVDLARLDLVRSHQRSGVVTGLRAGADTGGLTAGVGRRAARALDGAGLELGQLRSDLAVVGRPMETHLAVTVLAALAGLLVPFVVAVLAVLLGIGVAVHVPLLAALALALTGAVVPQVLVRSQAADRRRDFRHVVGSFLDLVAMSLAGGRGVPEALQSASELSDGWGMVRIRNALGSARLRGETPWAALGQLGAELRIAELRDLAAALALVAEDGAKVRDSLSARADSMRRRELAESEGKAGENSQAMLVAQLLLCVGFLIFLIYPAMVTVLGGGS